MKSYEELKRLFDRSEHAYMVTSLPFSRDSVIFYANPSARNILGLEREALVGQSAGDVMEQLGTVCNMETGPFFYGDGKVLELFCSSFDGDGCLCLVTEPGEREKRAAARLADYKRDMEEALQAANVANRAKTSFLSEMSHDIRTPMNAIAGMTDIALNYADDAQRVTDCLNKIKLASGHLMELIDGILDMSRIESGKMTLQEDDMQLADLIHELLIVIKPQANAKHIRFHWELHNIVCEHLMGDALKLRQIGINILSNAVKFTPEGGEICMKVEEVEESDGTVLLLLTFQDNGIGMSKEFAYRIFQPFERERSSTISRIEGSGLGMSITKKLVDMMGGAIAVDSEPGKGTEFRLRIPLRRSRKDPLRNKKAFGGKTVLVIRGEEEEMANLPAMLRELGMEADVASGGMDAVDYLNDTDIEGREYFALLTADRLEDLDIAVLLSDIRARKGENFPMLMLTGSDWSEMEYLLKRAGVDAFVPLPLFRSRLAEALYPYTEEGKEEQGRLGRKMTKNYSGKHLLLVEDNQLNMEIAKEFLSGTAIHIDTAGNGEEALETFLSKPEFYYNLILMDVQMPVMDGLEATRRIRALDREDALEVSIIAMTANAFAEDRKISMEAGMNAHITKPLDTRQLLDCLERWAGGEEDETISGKLSE